MQFRLKRDNSIIELHINTVTLNPVYDGTVELFRCFVCGSAISQHQGEVSKIMPISEPTQEMLVIKKCPECGTLYTFHTQVKEKPRPTKVVLFVEPGRLENLFMCFICRQPLLRYTLHGIYDIPDNKAVETPFKLKCPRNDCPADYVFLDLV
jgi:hypothetical protein